MNGTADCWEWGGPRNNRGGYGYLYVGGKKVLAHRHTWEIAHGPIPAGMLVLHRCDNPPCYNLDHLFLGTHADNVHDMHTKGRARNGRQGRTHCKHGHELTAANTYLDGNGHRVCRRCQADHQLAYTARRKGTI